MNDPKRWLDDDAATDLERDLLGAGARLSAPRGLEARVWRGVGAKLSATAAVGAVAASTTKAAAAGAGAGGAAAGGAAAGGLKASAAGAIALKTKLVIAALVVAGAGTGGALVATRVPAAASSPAENMHSTPTAMTVSPKAHERGPAPAEDATSVEPAPPAVLVVPVVAATEHAARAVKPTPVRAAPTPARETRASSETTASAVRVETERPKPEAASQLREDARALQEARAALAAGDPSAAEQRLAESSPTTALAPERDALRVRIAAARGDHSRASALAAAFLRSYPKSPLAPQMTKFVGGATNE